MQYAVNHDCLLCDGKGGHWGANCLGCTARKIIYLRSPDHKTSRKMQLQILNALTKERKDEVLELVARYDSGDNSDQINPQTAQTSNA